MKSLLLLLSLGLACAANVHAQSNEKIAFGGKLICALDEAGAVDCVTYDAFTRLQPPSNTPALTTISAGDVHVCGITETGAAFCWGDNNFGQLNAPDDVQFIAMSAGTNFSCGIATDNSVVCWGLDTHGETEPPSENRYTQTAHDEATSCGLQLDGKVSCWGQFPDLAARLDDYTFTKIDLDSYNGALCGVTDQNDVRCNYSSWDMLGDKIDVALSTILHCGLSATEGISCVTNYIYEPWQNHLAARIAEINSGPEVVALYGDSNGYDLRSARVCYELVTGEFGCIVRELVSSPVLPGDQANTPDPAFNLTADVYSDSTVELVWSSSFNNSGADIYRDNELLATTSNGSSYIDDTLLAGVTYEYSVALFDVNGVRSELSNSVSVTTGQEGTDSGYTPVIRPATPTGLTAVIYNPNEIELFWDRLAVLPADFNGYEIWRDHEFIAFTRGISFYDNSVQPDSVFHYDVVAVSRDGTMLGFNGTDVNTGAN